MDDKARLGLNVGTRTKLARECPYCGANANHLFSRFHRGYLKCSGCQLVFSEVSINHSEAYVGYSDTYDREWRGEGREGIYSEVLNMLHDHHRELIDVGCGGGKFLVMAEGMGKVSWGVELGMNDGAWAYESVRSQIFESLEAMPKDLKVDVVTLVNVLDQVPQPWDMLASIKEKLREGGMVVIRIPNFTVHGSIHRLAAMMPDKIARRIMALSVMHQFAFGREALNRIFDDQGYTHIRYFVSVSSQGDAYNQGLFYQLGKRVMVPLAKLISALSMQRFLIAPSILVVAEKGKVKRNG